MRIRVLEPASGRSALLYGTGAAVSVLLHGLFAVGITLIPEPAPDNRPVWVEGVLAIQEPDPEPEEAEPEEAQPEAPPPEPEPEPEAPPPVAAEPPEEPVRLDELPDPETPPPEAEPQRQVRRIAQGLSRDSFADGGATGHAARVGTTTAARAGPEHLTLDDAPAEHAVVPYTQTASPPRLRLNPPLVVPPEVREARIEGRVELEITIGPDGQVTEAVVIASLHPAADQGCIEHARRTRWRPLRLDGQPAAVSGVPFSCRYTMAMD